VAVGDTFTVDVIAG
jgi:hypothetical protein